MQALYSYADFEGMTLEDLVVYWMSRAYEETKPAHPWNFLAKQMMWTLCDALEKKFTSMTLTRDQQGVKRKISRVPSDINVETVKIDKCWHPDNAKKTDLHLSR